MTRRHEIEQHLHSMQDIREIMNSMKNLSLMETRKLARFLSNHRRVVDSIEQTATDFLVAHPHLQSSTAIVNELYILIGSEQGFCGDFNQALIDNFTFLTVAKPTSNIQVIAIGTKLFSLLQDHPQLLKALSGPTVGQEVDAVLTDLVNTISHPHNTVGSLTITSLHHDHEKEKIQVNAILPPFKNLTFPDRQYTNPPRLQLSPEHFYKSLIDHYLFAALYEMFYTSLMAEHYRRVQHLEGAIDRLEQQADELSKKRNMLRQEEITEEIEVIMLSAAVLD